MQSLFFELYFLLISKYKAMSSKNIVKQKFKKSWCMDMSTNTKRKYWIMDGVLHETLPVGYFPSKITNPIGKFIAGGETPAKAWANAAASFL